VARQPLQVDVEALLHIVRQMKASEALAILDAVGIEAEHVAESPHRWCAHTCPCRTFGA